MLVQGQHTPILQFRMAVHTHSLFTVVLIFMRLPVASSDQVLTEHQGGHVTLRCNLEAGQTPTSIYFQIKVNSELFIHGCYNGLLMKQPIPDTYMGRISVNCTQATMELRDLKLGDSGNYECITVSQLNGRTATDIRLIVTANYTVPFISIECGLGHHGNQTHGDGRVAKYCEISCQASKGYPVSDVTWTTPPGQTVTVRSNSTQNNTSHLWSVSSTVQLTCSQRTNISCAVGGAISQLYEICVPNEGDGVDMKMILASAVLLLVVLVAAVITLTMKKTCRHPPPDAVAAEGEPLASASPPGDAFEQMDSVVSAL